MRKSLFLFLVVLMISALAIPGQTAYAQITPFAEMNKSFSDTFISSGGTTVLSISIYNPNAFDLTNASWTDNMPIQITVVGIVSNNCGGTVTAAASTISLSSGFVPAQTGTTSGSCTVSVRVTATSPDIDTYINTVDNLDASGAGGIRITNASPASASLLVIHGTSQSIGVVKSFDREIVTGGSVSTLSIRLINPSNIRLTGITFIDNMPSGMVLANPVNFDVGSCEGTLTALSQSSFSFSGGSLGPASPSGPGQCTMTMSVTLIVNGSRTNEIGIGDVTTDQKISNTSLTRATLTQTAAPAASIRKSFAPNPITAGSTSMLTITIQNSGNIPITSMVLSDSLPTVPANLVIASAPAPVNNCGGTLDAVPRTGLIQLMNGSLAANASCTIVVPVTGSVAGIYINTIPGGDLSSDPNQTVIVPSTSAPLTILAPGGGGTGRGGGNNNPGVPTATASNFLIPVTGFAPGMVTKLDASSRTAYDTTGLNIEIPVLKVNSPIVGVEKMKGNWDVSWLQNQVGWLNGTAYPTWRGNSLLTGHVVGADGKPSIFSKLKALGVGEYIFVNNAGYRYTYKVLSNTFVQPNDKSVLKHDEKSYLTLITCDSYDEITGTYLRRVVVRALLVDVSLIK